MWRGGHETTPGLLVRPRPADLEARRVQPRSQVLEFRCFEEIPGKAALPETRLADRRSSCKEGARRWMAKAPYRSQLCGPGRRTADRTAETQSKCPLARMLLTGAGPAQRV